MFSRYDIPSSIPDGSIQRAGDNVLALVSEIASSPLLADPGEDKHGKVTFFDVAGLFMVVYPERIGTIINCTTILLSIFVIWFQHRKGGERRGSYYFMSNSHSILTFFSHYVLP